MILLDNFSSDYTLHSKNSGCISNYVLLYLHLQFECISAFTLRVWKHVVHFDFFSWRTQNIKKVVCRRLDTSHAQWLAYQVRK